MIKNSSYHSIHLDFIRFIADVSFEMGKKSIYLSKKFLDEVYKFIKDPMYWKTIYDAPLFFSILTDNDKTEVARKLLSNYLNVVDMFQSPLDFFEIKELEDLNLIKELDRLQVLYDNTESFSKPIIETISALHRTDCYLNDLIKWKRNLT